MEINLHTQFSLFDLLVLIGITQGVITSILLLRSKKNPRSNRLLALALLGFCFLSTKILLHTLGLWETQTFRYFPNGVELLLPPLIYFYLYTLLESDFRFKAHHILHFIPFLISQTYAFWVYFSVWGIPDLAEKDIIASFWNFDTVKTSEDYLSFISASFYIAFGYKKLKTYKVWLKDSISDNAYPEFSWMQKVFILFCCLGMILCVNLALNLIFPFDPYREFRWQGYFVFIAFLIYYLGFMGYQVPDIRRKKIESPATAAPAPKKQRSPEKQQEVVKALENAFQEEKVFLNPTLSIQELAKKLGFPPRTLSQVINHSFQKSFRDLVNEYRIEEVKEKLNDSSYEHLSILGIALECGFNSEATFYRIFKKNTGISPKEYLLQK